jgi:hypothetical protein
MTGPQSHVYYGSDNGLEPRSTHEASRSTLHQHQSVRRGQALNLREAAIYTLDDMMNGKATLNEFFAKVGQPQRSEAAANTLLNVSEDGYVIASNGRSVNIRPLFTDEALYIFVEIRRQQVVLGIS